MAVLNMEEECLVQGQAEILQHLLAFADSMALNCAVELGIADIIHKNAAPMTLHEIAAQLPTPSPDVAVLSRVMRLLVRKRVFVIHEDDHPGDENGADESRFGLTPASKWLLKTGEFTLAPMILWQNHPVALAPWHCLSQCVKEGGAAFEKVHGVGVWQYAAKDPHLNQLLNSAMACTANVATKAIISTYKGGFEGVSTLVDVGGGTGAAIGKIVEAYPHIKGINLDLPHVVAAAPERAGVTHVAGDMFVEIPRADCVFMKWILHDWSDAECVRVLKQIKKAIPEETGKLIIVDIVLQPDDVKGIWGDSRMRFDLIMIAHTSGKERTEMEWKNLLKEGGFNRYNIISLPSVSSIIEAFPN